MAFFKPKRNNVLDLTEKYKRQQEKLAEIKAEREEELGKQNSQDSTSNSGGGFFGFFDSAPANPTPTTSSSESDESINIESAEERRRKLAKRLLDITNKLEDLGNQIYHLQQRLEVVEKKVGVGEGY